MPCALFAHVMAKESSTHSGNDQHAGRLQGRHTIVSDRVTVSGLGLVNSDASVSLKINVKFFVDVTAITTRRIVFVSWPTTGMKQPALTLSFTDVAC